jgi:hypothetical protein
MAVENIIVQQNKLSINSWLLISSFVLARKMQSIQRWTSYDWTMISSYIQVPAWPSNGKVCLNNQSFVCLRHYRIWLTPSELHTAIPIQCEGDKTFGHSLSITHHKGLAKAKVQHQPFGHSPVHPFYTCYGNKASGGIQTSDLRDGNSSSRVCICRW